MSEILLGRASCFFGRSAWRSLLQWNRAALGRTVNRCQNLSGERRALGYNEGSGRRRHRQRRTFKISGRWYMIPQTFHKGDNLMGVEAMWGKTVRGSQCAQVVTRKQSIDLMFGCRN